MSTNGAVWPVMPRSLGNGFETRREPACEGSLVDSAKAGNADAFAQLVAPHYRCCLQKAYSILRNYPDAEDETQNACTQAWEKLWQYKGEGSFGGWLNRIVSNQCLSRIRDQKSLISVDEIFESQSSFRLELIDQRAQPEHAAGDKELSRVLIKEIHSLPPLLRDVIVMRDLRQMAMQDVAERLGISVPAAKTRLTRARCELKQRLDRIMSKAIYGNSLFRRTCQPQAPYVWAMCTHGNAGQF
jgi:RNA polymerase sigma-70 factor, ECF subfamily